MKKNGSETDQELSNKMKTSEFYIPCFLRSMKKSRSEPNQEVHKSMQKPGGVNIPCSLNPNTGIVSVPFSFEELIERAKQATKKTAPVTESYFELPFANNIIKSIKSGLTSYKISPQKEMEQLKKIQCFLEEVIALKETNTHSGKIVRLGGLLASNQVDITEEDISEARQEMWGNFGGISE